MQSDGKYGGDAEDSRCGPVDGLKEVSGSRWSGGYAELAELLLRVGGGGFAKEGERGAQAGQLRGAGGAGSEMMLQGGEVAAEGMWGAGEDHVAELLVS